MYRSYELSVLRVLLFLVTILVIQIAIGAIGYVLIPNQVIWQKLSIFIMSQLISYIIGIYLFYWRRGARFNFDKRAGFSGFYMALLVLGLAVFAANTLTPLVEMLPQSPEMIEAFEELSTMPWLAVLVIMVIAPVFEELIFRGIILRGLHNRYNAAVALVLSSVLFGAFHMNYQQFVAATLIGIVCGLLYLMTKSVRYAIAFHALYNFTVTVMSGIFVGTGINAQMPYVIGVVALAGVPIALYNMRKQLARSEA